MSRVLLVSSKSRFLDGFSCVGTVLEKHQERDLYVYCSYCPHRLSLPLTVSVFKQSHCMVRTYSNCVCPSTLSLFIKKHLQAQAKEGPFIA